MIIKGIFLSFFNISWIETMINAKCVKCTGSFKSSEYWFKMKRTDFPELCGPCRRERRDKMRN